MIYTEGLREIRDYGEQVLYELAEASKIAGSVSPEVSALLQEIEAPPGKRFESPVQAIHGEAARL